jgi:hypothetical protein
MSEFDKGTGWFCIVIWGYGWDGMGMGMGMGMGYCCLAMVFGAC